LIYGTCHGYLQLDLCHVSSLYHIFDVKVMWHCMLQKVGKYIPTYTLFTTIHLQGTCTLNTWPHTNIIQVWTQYLMEATQCLCHRTTPPFIGKGCITFVYVLNMKSLRNPKVDIFFCLKSWSNEANKNIMWNFIQNFIQ
jgi:hypothetical protein